MASSKPQKSSKQTKYVIEAKTLEQKPCQFPFIYKDVKYTECTPVDGWPEGTPWCSTKVDPNTLEHDKSDKYYGDCNDDQPVNTTPNFSDNVSQLNYSCR